MRESFVVAALMVAATVAFAEPKVSGGGTPPASATGQAQTSADEKSAPAAPAASKSSTARKALRALKGNDKKAKSDSK
jgi:hypothetical protein